MSEKLTDEVLEGVSGGMSRNLRAAYACLEGKYSSGDEQIYLLRKAGYKPDEILTLVDYLTKYEDVAKDVVRGKYGNGGARKAALENAGYDFDAVQKLVNNMMIKK